MKEYKRIKDEREAGFDDLEKQATRLAAEGWEVLTISDGSNFRTATLVREVPFENLPNNGFKTPELFAEAKRLTTKGKK